MRGRSGWFQLIMLIPIIGSIWLLVEVGFLRGTVGSNKYGDDPLMIDAPTPETSASIGAGVGAGAGADV